MLLRAAGRSGESAIRGATRNHWGGVVVGLFLVEKEPSVYAIDLIENKPIKQTKYNKYARTP